MCFSHLALHQPWIQANNKTPVSMTLAPAADGPRPPDLARARCRLRAVRIISLFITASTSGTLKRWCLGSYFIAPRSCFRHDPTFPTRGFSRVQHLVWVKLSWTQGWAQQTGHSRDTMGLHRTPKASALTRRNTPRGLYFKTKLTNMQSST